MDDKPTIGRVEFGPSLPATAARRPAVTARTRFADDATLRRLAALEAVAEAAEALRAVASLDIEHAYRGWECATCGWRWADVPEEIAHNPDCVRLALDAALARLRALDATPGGEA